MSELDRISSGNAFQIFGAATCKLYTVGVLADVNSFLKVFKYLKVLK